MSRTKVKRLPPVKPDLKIEHQLWRLVDGAVSNAFFYHPDYLKDRRRERVVRQSINKRVVGALMGFVNQAAPPVERGTAPVK